MTSVWAARFVNGQTTQPTAEASVRSSQEPFTFIELRPFTRRWEHLKLGDGDLQSLQHALMTSPRAGNVIPGTGGLRKIRFAPPQWKSGKRGALRVCYAYFEEVAHIVLAIVYGKNEKADLSAEEKARLWVEVERVKQWLLSHPYRYVPGFESENL